MARKGMYAPEKRKRGDYKMGEVFKAYTEEQEKELKEISESERYGNILGGTGAQESTLREILKALQRIEKVLTPENQGGIYKKSRYKCICEKVIDFLMGREICGKPSPPEVDCVSGLCD